MARRRLRVVHDDLPVPVVVERPGVDEFELGILPAAAGVLFAQSLIRKLRLRVVITPTQPRGRRRRVGVPPILLDVLSVIALRTRESEKALLEERVAPIPERHG